MIESKVLIIYGLAYLLQIKRPVFVYWPEYCGVYSLYARLLTDSDA